MSSLARFSLANAFTKFCSVSPAQNLHASVLNHAEAKPKALPVGFRAPRVLSLVLKDVYSPGMKIQDAGLKAKERYLSLSEHEKAAYKEQCDKIGAERRQKFEALPESEKAKLFEDAKNKLKKKKLFSNRQLVRKFHEESGRPKQPGNAYIFFLMAEREKVKPSSEEQTDFVSKAGQKWRGLSEQEKKPFVVKASTAKEEYFKKLDQWKETQPKKAFEEFKKKEKSAK